MNKTNTKTTTKANNKSTLSSASKKNSQKSSLRHGIHAMFASMKESDESAAKDLSKSENIQFVFGAILFLAACFVFLGLISYYFTGAEDQKLWTTNGVTNAQNWMGNWGARMARYMIDNWFGVSSIFIPIFMFATSIRIMNIFHVRLHKWFLNCTFLMVWISLFLAFTLQNWWPLSYISWGGQIGLKEVQLIRDRIGIIGVCLVLLITAFLYFIYLSDEAISKIKKALQHKKKPKENVEENVENIPEPKPVQKETPTKETSALEEERLKEPFVPFIDDPNTTATTISFEHTKKEPEIKLKPGEQMLPLETEKKEEKMEIVVGKDPEQATLDEKGALEPYDPKLDLSHYKYPTLDLLKKYDTDNSNIDMAEQQANKNQIIEVLRNFGVEISTIKATIGPTITLYEITPAPGVRISKIRNLEDDIALSLRAYGIRIIAPIPGKGTIGIEVPNAKAQTVSMESIINSRKFQETDYELPMALGKTITNEVFMVDLAKMPHLLVAGATGQGKSVGLNAIITSLLYKKHPAELKLVMVDPKKVEFSIYNPIVNHFLAQVEGNEDTDEPIITDVKKVTQTLKSLCLEMDTRYDLLKKACARNVKEYNQRFKNRELSPKNGHKFMPYIVVIIDEFGDLIMTAGKEIETPIARIAQLARAVGIHMIIATQRPTVNIITGTIKANFPARMAFKVSSIVDSKTILDRTGANQLIGRGDMLFLSGNEPVRVQCAFVDTPEVEAIAKFIACQQSYNMPFPLPEVPLDGDEEGESVDVDMTHLDPMFEEVARMVVMEQSGSTSMIQRKFSIGYNRAGRLMDQLEKAGIVGPAKGSKPREVLCISEEDLQFRIDNLK